MNTCYIFGFGVFCNGSYSRAAASIGMPIGMLLRLLIYLSQCARPIMVLIENAARWLGHGIVCNNIPATVRAVFCKEADVTAQLVYRYHKFAQTTGSRE